MASAPRAPCCACCRCWRTPTTACAPTRSPRRSARALDGVQPARHALPGGLRRPRPAAAYRLTDEAPARPPARARAPPGLDGILDELFARTHKRVYLAAAHSGQVVIPLARGRQGMPRIPGLRRGSARTPTRSRSARSRSSLLAPPRCERYIDRGLRASRRTRSPADELRAQLDDIRAGAVASDREEFGADFCCLAAPVSTARRAPSRRSGSRCPRAASSSERETLAEALRDVARGAAGPRTPRSGDPGRRRRS